MSAIQLLNFYLFYFQCAIQLLYFISMSYYSGKSPQGPWTYFWCLPHGSLKEASYVDPLAPQSYLATFLHRYEWTTLVGWPQWTCSISLSGENDLVCSKDSLLKLETIQQSLCFSVLSVVMAAAITFGVLRLRRSSCQCIGTNCAHESTMWLGSRSILGRIALWSHPLAHSYLPEQTKILFFLVSKEAGHLIRRQSGQMSHIAILPAMIVVTVVMNRTLPREPQENARP